MIYRKLTIHLFLSEVFLRLQVQYMMTISSPLVVRVMQTEFFLYPVLLYVEAWAVHLA